MYDARSTKYLDDYYLDQEAADLAVFFFENAITMHDYINVRSRPERSLAARMPQDPFEKLNRIDTRTHTG